MTPVLGVCHRWPGPQREKLAANLQPVLPMGAGTALPKRTKHAGTNTGVSLKSTGRAT